MENENFEVTEVAPSNPLKLILVVVALVIIVGGVAWWFVSTQLSQGENLTGEDISGTLQLSGIPIGTELVYPAIFSYVPENDSIDLLVNYPSYSYAKTPQGDHLIIGGTDSEKETDKVAPLRFESATGNVTPLPNVNLYNENDLAVSSDGRYYAYSYQTPNANPLVLSAWNVAIHDQQTGDVTTVTGAAEPEFYGESGEVLVMKTDGVYRFDLSSGDLFPVFTKYQSLTPTADFAVSLDGSQLILTISDQSTISVAQFDSSSQNYEEQGVFIDSVQRFRYPVISPDGTTYAVTAAIRGSVNQEFSDITVDIQFRNISTSELVYATNIGWIEAPSLRLVGWSN